MVPDETTSGIVEYPDTTNLYRVIPHDTFHREVSILPPGMKKTRGTTPCILGVNYLRILTLKASKWRIVYTRERWLDA